MTTDPTSRKNEIILYQPDNAIQLEVIIADDTAWLTQAQMVDLFAITKQNVSLHINNVFKEGELERNSVVKDYLTTAQDGKSYHTKYYNLDVIISVGYRVKSRRGTEFRIPPVEITPFEDALLCYIMLEHLDQRHYEYFGIIEGQSMTEDVRLGLYTKLTEEQKNILKRDFLIKHTVRITGISKRTALLIELAKLHFPDEMAVAEHTQNEEYEKKHQVIKEQIDKMCLENEEIKEVA
jgi:hypothetical protein